MFLSKLTVSGVPGASSSSDNFAFFDCFDGALGSSDLFLLSPALDMGLLKKIRDLVKIH